MPQFTERLSATLQLLHAWHNRTLLMGLKRYFFRVDPRSEKEDMIFSFFETVWVYTEKNYS